MLSWVKTVGPTDIIALVALILSLPNILDYWNAWFNIGDLKLVAPLSIEFRSDTPKMLELENGQLAAHRDGGRAIDAQATANKDLFAIVPITYKNTGDKGEYLTVLSENLIISTDDVDAPAYEFSAVHNTEIVPAELRHWWWGDVKPWLPTLIDGGEIRSTEVIFRTTKCQKDCSWASFITYIAAQKSDLKILYTVETAEEGNFTSSICKIGRKEILDNKDAVPGDRKAHFRRGAFCERNEKK